MVKETFNEVNEFCWLLRDGINELVENHIKFDVVTNLSKLERGALINLIVVKNKIHIINDTDKKLGLENADKLDMVESVTDNCLTL